MRRFRIGLQPFADLETVHARHHNVQQDDIDLFLVADIKRLETILGGYDVEIFRDKPGFEKLYVCGYVVNNQNSRRHNSSPTALRIA
ncbi:hypothetical protein D3C86_1904920 [compost metagenome]